jgi:hypothetical protein
LTQFFSKQQRHSFSRVRSEQKTISARITKSIVAEMTPLLKLSQRTTRKELRQKQWHLLLLAELPGQQKRPQNAWKSYGVSEIL